MMRLVAVLRPPACDGAHSVLREPAADLVSTNGEYSLLNCIRE